MTCSQENAEEQSANFKAISEACPHAEEQIPTCMQGFNNFFQPSIFLLCTQLAQPYEPGEALNPPQNVHLLRCAVLLACCQEQHSRVPPVLEDIGHSIEPGQVVLAAL